jgi:hypothetical protein
MPVCQCKLQSLTRRVIFFHFQGLLAKIKDFMALRVLQLALPFRFETEKSMEKSGAKSRHIFANT